MTLLKDFYRPHEGRMVAGVCAGVARKVGVDANIVRAAMGVGVFVGGVSLWVYPIAWAVMPDEGSDKTIADDLVIRAKGFIDEQKVKAEQAAKDAQSSTDATAPVSSQGEPTPPSVPTPSPSAEEKPEGDVIS